MMTVVYEIHVEIEPGEQTDLISIMDNLANAIERVRQEDMITSHDDETTIIGKITLYLDDEKQPY